MWFAGPAPEAPSPRHGSLNAGLHLEPGMRVGLLGGSFNPAHPGHAHVAETARLRLRLDRVIWLVSPQNPLKASNDTAPLKQRMASAREQADGPKMIVSDFETRIGARYTIDTLRALKARYPGVHFVWIMGGDNLATFHCWRGWTDIFRLMPIAVVARPGSLLDSRFAPATKRFAHCRLPSRAGALLATAKTPAWIYLRAPLNAASSSAIRGSATQRRT
ncbi:MAG TPA: nicotinate-nucleotide adenylyltransferase [Caulobacteraceae bacterium]|jgi:nicotinate-nucleotide adenylyltransferase|nr:nicotinate-nucleotide adenylyltransferase [Caulobacteraceae bacterium]